MTTVDTQVPAGRRSGWAGGRTLREWEIYAVDKEIEVASGVRFAAWTFNGRVPGPTLRCTEGDRLRITFKIGSDHPHTMHFHGIHPSEMDGAPGAGAGVIPSGGSTVYEFDAEPFGLHLFHCHVGPLAEHIARGLYGTFIVDPPNPRPPADELVMVMHGYNTTEGLAIVAPLTSQPRPWPRLLALGIVAGAPAILGALIGATVAALLLGAGAIAKVIVQIWPSLKENPGEPLSKPVLGGLAGGILTMYLTGLLA